MLHQSSNTLHRPGDSEAVAQLVEFVEVPIHLPEEGVVSMNGKDREGWGVAVGAHFGVESGIGVCEACRRSHSAHWHVSVLTCA